MSRFFAFGCSYTDYNWPTWADILCKHYHNQGWEVYNYGNSGTGNVAIMHHINLADTLHNFTNDDVICVMWTSWSREDRLAYWHDSTPGPNVWPQWNKYGNALSNSLFDERWIKMYWSLENDVVSSVTAMRMIKKCYPQIAFNGSIVHNEVNEHKTLDATNLFDTYNLLTPKNSFYQTRNPDFQRVCNLENERMPNIMQYDGHPTPGKHLWVVEKLIGPKIGISSVSDEIRAWVDQWDQRIVELDTKVDPLSSLPYNYRHDCDLLIRNETAEYAKRHWHLWGTQCPIWNPEPEQNTTDIVNEYLTKNLRLI
jgi:hypothetical protein